MFLLLLLFLLLCSLEVVSYSLRPHELQHADLLSFAISWSLLKLMSFVTVMLSNHLILCHPLLFCLPSFPSSGSFPMSWLFSSGGQSIGASASASVLPINIQDWSPLGLICLISLEPKDVQEFSSAQWFKRINSLWSRN